MGTDSVEHDAGLPDRSREFDVGQPGKTRDLPARLEALPEWHPSSPRYQPELPPDTTAEPPGTSHADADGQSAPDDASGWDALGEEAPDHPLPADIRVSAERRVHILDGDQTGGGHRHGVGSPGKTEFPADWDDDKVMDNLLSVAREPDQVPVHQNWNGRWRVQGERDRVGIVAIVASDGELWSGWPREGSPGVVKNQPEDK